MAWSGATSNEQAAAHPKAVAAALEQDPGSYLFFDLVGSAERTAQWNAREVRPDAYFCGAAAIIDGQIRYIHFPYFSYPVPVEERPPDLTADELQTADRFGAKRRELIDARPAARESERVLTTLPKAAEF